MNFERSQHTTIYRSEDEIKVSQLKFSSQSFMSKMLVVFNYLPVIPLTNMFVVLLSLSHPINRNIESSLTPSLLMLWSRPWSEYLLWEADEQEDSLSVLLVVGDFHPCL
jgi:hypothetical protein